MSTNKKCVYLYTRGDGPDRLILLFRLQREASVEPCFVLKVNSIPSRCFLINPEVSLKNLKRWPSGRSVISAVNRSVNFGNS